MYYTYAGILDASWEYIPEYLELDISIESYISNRLVGILNGHISLQCDEIDEDGECYFQFIADTPSIHSISGSIVLHPPIEISEDDYSSPPWDV